MARAGWATVMGSAERWWTVAMRLLWGLLPPCSSGKGWRWGMSAATVLEAGMAAAWRVAGKGSVARGRWMKKLLPLLLAGAERDGPGL